MSRVKALLNKVSNMSPAAKASFWFIVANISLKGISFITTPIFTRLLNVADYGTTSVFVTWESVISVFATMALSGGVFNVAMTKFEDDIDRYTSSMMGLTFLTSVTVYAICILINTMFPQLFELDNSFLIFMWIQGYTNSAIAFWLNRKRFNYKYKPVITYSVATALLSPIIAIITIQLFPQNKAYAKVVGAGLFGITFGTIMCVYNIYKGKTVYHKKYWIHALKFNIPLIPHYLSNNILASGDKLMLNSLVGKVEAGLYSIAHSITGTISIVTQAINYSFIPYTLQSIKKQNYKGLSKTLTGCSALIACVCTAVVFFAKEGILIFATPDYINAVWYIAPLALSTEISFVTGLVGNTLFYYEKTIHMSTVTLICAGFNLGTNFLGLKFLPSDICQYTVAYTTLFSELLRFVLLYAITSKYEKNLSKILNIRNFTVIMLASLGFMVLATIFYDYIFIRIGIILAIFITAFIMRKKIVNLFKNMKSE